MKLLNEKTLNYYKENPTFIKFRIKDIKKAIKKCDYLINNEQEIYMLSKFDDVDEVIAYKDYLFYELNTFKMLKREYEKRSLI